MKLIVRIFLLSLFSFQFSLLNAQAPPTYNSADIYLHLKKLNVLGSVLYIAAHPDDENTRLLAYLSKEKQYRTGYMSLTRGDGGQNLIGDEQGIELGLIRTQELLAARRIDGAEQFFSRAYDFGFCKTSKEALATWGHDKILSDVVWVIKIVLSNNAVDLILYSIGIYPFPAIVHSIHQIILWGISTCCKKIFISRTSLPWYTKTLAFVLTATITCNFPRNFFQSGCCKHQHPI